MKRGFTLTEILASMAILSLIIVGIYGILNIGEITYNEDMGLLDLQQQTRQVMNSMIKEIRQSSSVNISISSGGARINFRIPTDITTNPITYSSLITYYLSNDQIIRQHAGTDTVLANDISALSFCCWHGSTCDTDCSNSQILQIQLGAEKTIKQRVLSFSLTEKVRLRNE